MKKLFVLFCLLTTIVTFGQAPQYLNYQGVARDASGNIISTPVGIKFEIIQGSAGGTVVYEETNNLTPSSVGIFTAAIGNGIPVSGTFSLTNWAGGPYFIRVSMDPAGGTSYSAMGTSQLLSVPYALYAEKAGNTQTVNITGPNVTGTYPNYTITAPAALTTSTGISIVGGTITNTAPDQTVNLAAAGISSVTGTYPSYTIDVPPPSLGYNSLTNVLSLTQGTAVTTTTLVGSGSNTVAMFASGIASVNPVGAGSSFTVSVPSPSFTSVGATSVTGTYPNFVINSPGASTTTPTSLQINPPHTTSTISANNFSINVLPTNISGPGVSGTYPNYTVASSPATSITAGGSNIIVNGGPSFTISATTPTIQINAPNSVTPLGLNNYSINIPAVNLTGAGVATVSGTYPTFTVGVSAPTITASGNTLTITQGTSVSTSTFSGGPWTASGGVLYPSANPINDKVAIGQNTAASNLDVMNAAAGTNSLNPVVSINNNNPSFNAAGVLSVKNNIGGGAAIYAENNSTIGDGIAINLNNASNGSTALQVSNNGTGYAGYFGNTNALSSSRVLDVTTNGLGSGIWVVNTNSLNTAATIYGNTNGNTTMFLNNTNSSGTAASLNSIGTAVYGTNSGPFHTFQAQNTNATAGIYAGYFSGGINSIGKSSSNSTHSFRAQNSSLIDVFAVRDDGNVGVGTASPNARLDVQGLGTFTGNVVNVNNANSANSNAALYVTTQGTGGAIYAINSNAAGNAGNIYNTNASNASTALLVQNNGSGNGLDVYNVGGGRALYAGNTSTISTTFLNNRGYG